MFYAYEHTINPALGCRCSENETNRSEEGVAFRPKRQSRAFNENQQQEGLRTRPPARDMSFGCSSVHIYMRVAAQRVPSINVIEGTARRASFKCHI